MGATSILMNLATELLIRSTVKRLPVPLVGAVAFDGQKHTKDVTPKCLAAFADLFSLIRPTRILEIGTHAGHSSCMMLGFSDASIVSVDIGTVWIGANHSFADWSTTSAEGGLLYVEQVLREAYGRDRFTLIIGDSTSEQVDDHLTALHHIRPFDCAFVDGDHSYPYVNSDIALARSFGIKDIIVDDYNNDQSDTARAAREHGLVMVKEWKDLHSSGVSTALMRAP